MDSESRYLLQLIDSNCNDCVFMIRDMAKRASFDHLHVGQLNAGHRLNYGNCKIKENEPVSFIPNYCMPENQQCFKHRRDDKEKSK